ncbi:MAG: hypothetical protein EOP50_15280, partial [Sphingobacteriales bacterium]
MRYAVLATLLGLQLSCGAQQNHTYKVTATYRIASPGGWDYIATHQGKLYVSHGTQVNILEEATGEARYVLKICRSEYATVELEAQNAALAHIAAKPGAPRVP